MQEPNGLNSVHRELELTLKSLAPAAPTIDPVAAAFAAGRQSARRQVRAWQAAASVLLLAGLGTWLMPDRHAPVAPSHDTGGSTLAVVSPTPAMQPLPSESILMLQQTLRAKGLDGLPAANVPAVGVMQSKDVL